MVAEQYISIITLPDNEKRRLAQMLLDDIDSVDVKPKKENTKLRHALIKHITKKRK